MASYLLQDWKFMLEPQGQKERCAGAWNRGYDDSDWRDVVVPHDWSVSGGFSRAHSSGTGYLPGGTGWYRCHFHLPEDQTDPKALITFDGVYKNSQVWVNSYYLGKRPFGYASFTYDISDYLFYGDRENVVTVKVTHEDIADSRWFTGSGIYRKVQLRLCPKVYAPDDSLVFEAVPDLNGSADITVRGAVRNDTEKDERVQVHASLKDESGRITELPIQTVSVKPGDRAEFQTETRLPDVKLWSPETPNLYTLTISVRGAQTAENAPIRVGVRSVRFDPDEGFFLNGQNRKIKGVCVHHDAGCLGAAVWPAVWQRRLKKLKDMGCDAIRTAHNPHMPELYDLCDEMGFLVMDEAFDEWEGVKNKWSTGHNVYPPKHQGYYEDFPDWHERDLSMMVRRDRNHPSVILWSVGNEIDYPNDPYCHPLFSEMVGNNDNNKPKAEMLYSENKPNMRRLSAVARELSAIVRRHDATRPVLTASAFPELSAQLGFFDSFDVIGYNYKEHLYDQDHARFPALPIFGSENGHSLEAWRAVTDKPFIAGQFLWTGIDFLGETVGWPWHGSQAGLLDVAGFEKIGYYRRQSLWTDDPVACLSTRIGAEQPRRSFDYAPGEKIEVLCYTNLVEAELFLNGESLGARRKGELDDHLSWTVPFARGDVRVVATEGIRRAEDTLSSTLPQARLNATIWRTPPHLAGDTGAYAIRQIEVFALDEEGRLCPAAEPMLEVETEGSAALLGIENGDLSDNDEYALPRRRMRRGRAIVYARVNTEDHQPAIVRVLAEGFMAVMLDVTVG